jgi:alpha-galactosidase
VPRSPRFERDGEDLYPRLVERVAGDSELQRHVRVDMHRRLGYFPTESSEHSAEYLPWYMRDDDALERFRIPVGEYVRRSERNLVEYDHVREALARGEELGEVETGVEYAPQIIHSMVTGVERVIYGNVANDRLIDDLPHGACVEVPCVVDRTGVRPTRIGSLPPQCAALNRTFLNVCDLAVRAALEGSQERLIQAALVDPNAAATLDPDTIATVCDELAEAHGLGLAAPVRA